MLVKELTNYGVAQTVIDKLINMGIIKLTDVQKLAIEHGLFENVNLMISAPTNTGKTFIGELAALNASTKGKRTFYLVPLKALAEEKFEDFKRKYSDFGMKIAVTTHDRTEFDSNLLNFDIIIATYEKLQVLLTRNPELLNDIGVIVIDEVQNIGSKDRGANLEILLTRMLWSEKRPQIIALSATTPNAKDIAKWLNAKLIETKKRDVELQEGIIYIGNKPFNFLNHEIREGDFVYKEFNSGEIKIDRGVNYSNFETLVQLSEKEQLLIFVNTRRETEKLAHLLAPHMPISSSALKWIEELDTKIEPTPSTRRLKKYLENGVAFHHAGLLPEERALIERAFEGGDIRILCATTTLSAGINTPAKTVVIRDYKSYNEENIPVRDYKNISGRAGRLRKKDFFGRSVLLAKSEKEFLFLWNNYINGQAEYVLSQLPQSERLDLILLVIIVSGIASTPNGILDFLKRTLFGFSLYEKSTESHENFNKEIVKTLERLGKDDFLKMKNNTITVSELGKICAEELISPKTARLIYDGLKELQKRIYANKTKDYEGFAEPIIHLACCTYDAINSGSLLYLPHSKQEQKELMDYWEYNKDNFIHKPGISELILRSVRTTHMLMRWIEGVPYSDLSSFASHGTVRKIAENISWIIKTMTRIADKPLFNFSSEFLEFMKVLSDRVHFGVKPNAIKLMELRIPMVHRYRAMQLAENGLDTINKLINVDIDTLRKIKGIGKETALEIKHYTERYIKDKNERSYQIQIRKAKEMGRDPTILKRLYTEKGKNFAKACIEVLKDYIGLPCYYVGGEPGHEVDGIIRLKEGNIVIECTKRENKLVSAQDAERVLGEGAKHKPIAHITIGSPDFSSEAIENVKNTNITLITHRKLGEILIRFWEGEIDKNGIIELLKSGRYIDETETNSSLA